MILPFLIAILILNFLTITIYAPLPPIKTCEERKDWDSCVDDCECQWCISDDYCYNHEDEFQCEHHSHISDKCKNTMPFNKFDVMIPLFPAIVIIMFLCMCIVAAFFLYNYCLYLYTHR